jgi:hypothetical protein
VATDAAELYSFTGLSSLEHRAESGDERGWIVRDPEVWPIDVLVGPGRLPAPVQVEPKARRLLSGVGVWHIEGHGSDLGALRQNHR